MRVTSNMQNQSLFNSVNTNQALMSILQMQLASGHKVNSASDNPGAIPSIMDSNMMLNRIETYQSNITFLTGETEVTDGILGQISDKIQRMRDLTIDAANATNSPDQLKMINDEMQQIKEHLVSLANTKYQNSYIFAGNKTQTQPYEILDNGSIVYKGTPSSGDYEREYSISDGVNIVINLPGDKVFGYSHLVNAGPPAEYKGEGIFHTANILTNLLESDVPDYEAIRSQIDSLDAAVEEITAARTEIGGMQSRLNMTSEQHETSKITYESLRANFQDVDVAQVVSELATQEVSLQASMYVSSQIMGISLLDYL